MIMTRILHHISMNINNLSFVIILFMLIQFSNCKSNNTTYNQHYNFEDAINNIIDEYLKTEIGKKSIGAYIKILYLDNSNFNSNYQIFIIPILDSCEESFFPFDPHIINYDLLYTTITNCIEISGKIFLLEDKRKPCSELNFNILIKYGLVEKLFQNRICTEPYNCYYIVETNKIIKIDNHETIFIF